MQLLRSDAFWKIAAATGIFDRWRRLLAAASNLTGVLQLVASRVFTGQNYWKLLQQ